MTNKEAAAIIKTILDSGYNSITLNDYRKRALYHALEVLKNQDHIKAEIGRIKSFREEGEE